VYDQVVISELDEDEMSKIKDIDLKTYAVKYLGITEGKIGILSRKLPMGMTAKDRKVPKPALPRSVSVKTINK